MLKLRLQYFDYLMWRADSFEKNWCWERLKAGEGDDRGWDDWIASPTQWTLVWGNSRRWWWTGRPGVLQSVGSQKVGHSWVTEQQQMSLAIGFPVVMYGCWTIKKAECQRIDAFELWWWRRFLRVPWTARRFNQSILKETSPGCSLEGLMLRLKL